MKTIILGLGNPILTDDGVGIKVAHRIKEEYANIDIKESSAAGFRIVDEIIGYDKLILIDSTKTGKSTPGTLYRFKKTDFKKTQHHSSPHDIGLFDAFDIYEKTGVKLPEHVVIYGIEVENTNTFSDKCTEQVEKSIPRIVKQIIAEQFN